MAMPGEFAPWFTGKRRNDKQITARSGSRLCYGFATLAFASPRSGANNSMCHPCGEEKVLPMR
jgi:hypothetical protein